MGMDVYSKDENHYFRANVWSWRPIHMLCEEANQCDELGFDMGGWDCNSGCGLETAEDCVRLAGSLRKLLTEQYQETEVISLDSAPQGVEAAMLEQVGEAFGLPKDGVVMSDTTYSAAKAHVEEFVEFLEKADGFKIW